MTEPAALSDERPPRRLTPFLPTRQHRRFAEFADAVRRHRYIGACYGAPGIGKTLSARTYAAADDYDRWATDRFMRSAVLPPSLLSSRTAMLTRGVTTTPRDLENQLLNRCYALNADIARTLRPDVNLELSREPVVGLELLIIDEAHRLKTAALEMVRDDFGNGDVGIVLIGMPGFERRLARYPQLYSRVGFAHQYRPLDSTDIPQVLARYWQELGFSYDSHRPADAESVVTIVRITGGNFATRRTPHEPSRAHHDHQPPRRHHPRRHRSRPRGPRRRHLIWPLNWNRVSQIIRQVTEQTLPLLVEAGVR